MLDSSSDAVTDSCKQSAHGESALTQRRHEVTRTAEKPIANADVSAASAFPPRVDLAHVDQPAVACPRGSFFERKYVADRCFGGVMLVLFSPLILLLYFVVRMTSRGPGIYKQERVGLNGETFEIFKLRSMVMNAEKPGQPQWAVKGDSRVNLVGSILRKLHLDELPQLYNVWRGDMSLVGPRPERPQICEKLAAQIPGYYDRTAVKPGVTGLAQINLPPDESIDDVCRKQILDLHYIENAGFWLDTRMIFATALRMVGLKGGLVTSLMRLNRTYLVKDVVSPTGFAASSPVKLARPAVRSDSTTDSRNPYGASLAMSSDGSAAYVAPNRPR